MSDFRAQIETNLFGTIIVTKAALPVLSPKESRSLCPVFVDGRKDWASRAWALFGCEMGCRGFLRSVVRARSGAAGHQVTIVEPGGFRTDFAGSSTKLSEGNPDYDSTVEATARFQRDYNGKQPGDPKKAAQAIVRLTQERKPPLRLLLGSDAYNGAEKNDLARLEEARSWKEPACPLISSQSPHTWSDQSEPAFAGIRPTDVPPFSRRANRRSTLRIFCFRWLMSKTAKSKATVCSRVVLETAAKIAQILGKALGKRWAANECFGATEELLALTKQTRIDQCERVQSESPTLHLPLTTGFQIPLSRMFSVD